jgi:hypothetical protein
MTSQEREQYINILTDFTQCVFKISINITSMNNTDTVNYIWENICDVTKWFKIEYEKDFYDESSIDQILSDNNCKIEITGGTLFPLLVLLYIIKFLNTKKFNPSVNFAIETYGTKDHYKHIVIENEDEGNETNFAINKTENNSSLAGENICNKFLKFNNLSPICLIQKFTKYCAEEFKINNDNITLIVGIGANLSAKNQDNDKSCYSVINPILTIDEENNTFDTYPIFGNLISSRMQPSTVTSKNKNLNFPNSSCSNAIRYQQYNWNARHLKGEYLPLNGEKESTKMSQYSRYSDGDCFQLHTYLNEAETFLENKLNELNELKSYHGNVARVEIAFKISPDKMENDLSSAFSNVLEICLTKYECYDYEQFLTVFHFLLLGYYFRLHVLSLMMVNDTYYEYRYFEMIDILTFHSGAINKMFNGKYTFNDGRSYLPKTSLKNNRTIFPKLSPKLYERRENILNNNVYENSDIVKKYFFENIYEIPCGVQNPFVVHMRKNVYEDAYYCISCKKIFFKDNQINAFENHPCDNIDMNINHKYKLNTEMFIKFHQNNVLNLSTAQKQIYDEFFGSKSHKNFLLMGIAGSGKSFTINVIMEKIMLEKGRKSCASVAWTKQGAMQVHGETICSFFKISGTDVDVLAENYVEINLKHQEIRDDIMKKTIDEFNKSFNKLESMLQLQYLIIDECSMIAATLLQFIDLFFRRIFNNLDCVFGGLKIILVGDVMQLPPINKDNIPIFYFFESTSYFNGNFSVAYLSQSFRQNNQLFIDILNRIRIGETTDDDLIEINKNWGKKLNITYIKYLYNCCKNLVNSEISATNKNDNKEMSKIKTKYRNEIFGYASYRAAGMINNCNQKNYFPYYSALNQIIKDCETLQENQLNKLENTSEDSITDKSFKPPIIIGVERIENNYYNEQMFHYLYHNRKVSEILTSNEVDEITWSNPSITSLFDFTKKMLIKKMEKECNLLSELKLTIGMPVMFTSNQVDEFVANNQLGVIINFENEWIDIQPNYKNKQINKIIRVFKETFVYNHLYGGTTYTITRKQYPIKPALTANVHPMQGSTISPPQTIVFNNQRLQSDHTAVAYTVLSRPEDPDFIFPLFPLEMRDIRVIPKCKSFDEYHRKLDNVINDVYYTVEHGYIVPNDLTKIEIIVNEDKYSTSDLFVPTFSHKAIVANLIL